MEGIFLVEGCPRVCVAVDLWMPMMLAGIKGYRLDRRTNMGRDASVVRPEDCHSTTLICTATIPPVNS